MVFQSFWGTFIDFFPQDRGLCEFSAGLELTIQQRMILNFWASFCLYFPGPRVGGMYVCLFMLWQGLNPGMHSTNQAALPAADALLPTTFFHSIHLSSMLPATLAVRTKAEQKQTLLFSETNKKEYFSSSFSQLSSRKCVSEFSDEVWASYQRQEGGIPLLHSPRVGQSLSSRTSMAACVLLPVTVTVDCTGIIKRL